MVNNECGYNKVSTVVVFKHSLAVKVSSNVRSLAYGNGLTLSCSVESRVRHQGTHSPAVSQAHFHPGNPQRNLRIATCKALSYRTAAFLQNELNKPMNLSLSIVLFSKIYFPLSVLLSSDTQAFFSLIRAQCVI